MKYENCIEKQTIEYTHTTVPASMRSPYWKYFGFPADGANNILTRQKIICTLCGAAITYNKNTSNLRTHLISRHQERLHEMHQQQRDSGGSSSNDASKTLLSNAELTDESTDFGTLKRSYIAEEVKSLGEEVISVAKVGRVGGSASGGDAALVDGGLLDVHGTHSTEDNSLRGDVASATIGADTSDYEYFTTDAIETDAASLDDDDTDDAQDEGEAVAVCSSGVVIDSANCDAIRIHSSDEVTVKPVFTFAVNMPPILPVKDSTKPTQVGVSGIDMVAEMLVNDLLPLSVLRASGFQQLMQLIGGVDECTVETKILDDYAKLRHNVTDYLSSSILQHDTPFSLSMEFYINIEGNEIINIYINYLDFGSNIELLSILYDTVVGSKADLTQVLKGLDISRCAAIVTTDTTNTMLVNFARSNSIPVVECLYTSLTRCLGRIFELDVVKNDFELICKSLESSKDMPELLLPCPWSKLNFLQVFLESAHAKDMQYKEISKELHPFIAYINPLKITFDTILQEPLPLCTLVRPLITKLVEEHFSSFYTESSKYLEASHAIVTAELSNCITKSTFWSEASLFDVRFQQEFIHHTPQHQEQQLQHQQSMAISIDVHSRAHIEASVCKRFHQLIERTNTNCQLKLLKDEKQLQEESATNVKAPTSSLRLFFHRISDAAIAVHRKNTSTPPPPPKSSIELEFNRYKYEPTLDLEQCPISWWQLHAQHYKQLHKISNFYLCVPCCVQRWLSTDVNEPNERVVWRQKRCALRQHQRVERCLWYLHYNRKVLDKIKNKV